MLKTLSAKLGMTPEELKETLQTGNLDGAVKNMGAGDKQKLQSVIGNKAKLEKIMQSPQAKALYEKLTGSKPD
ncbi:MAG: hypothetical protein ACI4JN_10520 [Ruminococcus sp.]